MRKLATFLVVPVILFPALLFGQMWNGQDTLYGHEWIVAEQDYFKLPVSQDGWYRISYEQMVQAGLPVETIQSEQWQLWHQGQTEPLFVSAQGNLQPDDYLQFYGQHNRGVFDQYLYRSPEDQQLNPHYSLITDTSYYYLSWTNNANQGQYDRVENELGTLPPAEPFVWKEKAQVFTQHFMKEHYRFEGATLYYSHYGIGEGYGNRSIEALQASGSTTQTLTIDLDDIYPAGPDVQLATRFVAAYQDHQQSLQLNGTTIYADDYSSWQMANIDTTISIDLLTGGQAELSWTGSANNFDEVSVGFASVRYPALPQADGQSTLKCWLRPANNPILLEISDFDSNAGVKLFDRTNRIWMEAAFLDGKLLFVLPPSTEERELLILADENTAASSTLQAVDLTLPSLGSADFLILTHSLFHDNPQSPVQAYADYRNSATGGQYNVMIQKVEPLYDLFGFGIQHHPQAIRNFIHWALQVDPALNYLLIVGKGREYDELRQPDQLNTALGQTFFIPSFGFPASDNLLVADVQIPTPKVRVGRLPIVAAEQLTHYLAKVQALEAQQNAGQSIEERAWMKNILHLGGGSSTSQQQSIREFMDSMAEEIETGTLGATVNSFYKTNGDPIQVSEAGRIFDRIQDGVSIITIFGHSATAGAFDFNIDQPENYQNAGRCPLFISLGCYSGNIFAANESVGERFVFQENTGAVAFAASRGIGYLHAMGAFNRQFYREFGREQYGGTIGEGIQATIRHYENFTDLPYGALIEQFTLLGDPAIRLNVAPGPDYTFDTGTAHFDPPIVSVQKDSFSFSVDLYNLGANAVDSLELLIEQKLPNGEVVVYPDIKVEAPAYRSTLDIRLPSLGKPSVGLNTLSARIDPSNSITEQPSPAAESNNDLVQINGQFGIPLYVVDNTATPVWPPEYGLAGEADVTLKASTAEALAPERTYRLELATDPDFNSTIQSTEVTQIGGTIRWAPSISWQDSTVYYWRISPDSTGSIVNDYVWETSSFTYLNGAGNGWSQGHWGQYQDNELENLQVNSEANSIDFADNVRDVILKNKVYDPADPPTYVTNNSNWGSPWPWTINEGIQVVVIDSATTLHWKNYPPGDYGSVNTRSSWIKTFPFRTQTQAQRGQLIDFLTEVIPDGHYVIVYSALRNTSSSFYPENWAADSIALGANLFSVLEGEGATVIRELEEGGSRPYTFMYQKGGEALQEAIAPDINGVLLNQQGFAGSWYEGQLLTELIGPARQWGLFSWKQKPAAFSATDSTLIRLYAHNPTNESDSLIAEISTEGDFSLEHVSAEEFPFLRIDFLARDVPQRTAPSPAYWRVLYDGFPDITFSPADHISMLPDSLPEGAPLSISASVENLAPAGIDSILVAYSIAPDGAALQRRWLPLSGTESAVLDLSLDTKGLSGDQVLQVQLNPGPEQTERHYFNNFLQWPFRVNADIINPHLDITFDGQKILDGDLVSSEPEIQVTITDENPYLRLTDTSNLRIFLFPPDGQFELIDFDGTTNEFIGAATSGANQARALLRPTLSQSGEYKLRVEATDASENAAGRLLYELRFQVDLAKKITNVLPYPNPFTTQAHFVYTLTGDEPPANFSIQILTVSGRLVRTLDEGDLGALRIGTHRTDYAWDGTDEYGDRLANGVYLYRVVVRDEMGADYELRESQADQFFANGLGKIVLLR